MWEVIVLTTGMLSPIWDDCVHTVLSPLKASNSKADFPASAEGTVNGDGGRFVWFRV